ncbi:TylF/MycF/NovP-related O-methyltransferase [Nitrospinota bacterium]
MVHLKFVINGTEFEYKDIIMEDPGDAHFIETISKFSPYTMTTMHGLESPYALYKAIQYIVEKEIPGDIVECGVWRGGSIILSALALKHFGDLSRKLFLYDTFQGMTRPEDRDVDWDGVSPKARWDADRDISRMGFGGTLEEVRKNVFSSGYPEDKFIFVEGDVEETIPGTVPENISLLRLDTDWYRSTYHELVHLYPLLSVGGILIIDDYGWCRGAREATDKYLKEENPMLFLSRINSTVRLGVKMENER